jgi:orotidine-5'-phosphate decarboxylase
MSFSDKLKAAWKASNSLVCVGLDPEPRKFPDRFRDAPGGIFEFNKAIVDATRDLVCAYKPQFAHYAAHGAEQQLEHTIDYIKATAPDAIVILDSKRGDIGSTAEQYAHEAFERYGADAVTVNPYLGRDSVEPSSSTPTRASSFFAARQILARATCRTCTSAPARRCTSTWRRRWQRTGMPPAIA